MNETEPTALPPDDEKLPWGKIAAAALLAMAIFGVGIAWSIYLLHADGQGWVPGSARPAGEIGRPEIGIVDQRMFVSEQRGWELVDQQRAQLDSYGWVDRDAGLIHIPIERAIELTIEEHRP